jgi:mono/diheme cytochrome c family protein
MNIRWLIIPVLSVLFACNTTTNPSTVLTKDRLENQSFNINTERDTILTTREGIEVSIPAGSIKAATAAVTLEIKEALSLYDIIRSGLTTQAGKDILSSNGMFYINTKEPSTIIKPLSVKIPAVYADTAMKLYKGDTSKGKIDWKDPQPLAVKPSVTIDKGKLLYNQNCASCHNTHKQLTGPALAYVEERWESTDLLYQFIRNSASVLARGDLYANCLFCEYKKTSMPAYPALTDEDITDILSFVKRETVRLNIPRAAARKTDSVKYYQKRYQELSLKRDSLVKDNGYKVTLSGTANRRETGTLPKVVPVRTYAEYYQINIVAYGWYNIDQILNDPGVIETKLVVKVSSDYSQPINTYLIIPEAKVFAEGGLLDDNKGYGFYDPNGSVYLPAGKKAFVIAIGEEKGKLFYGQQQFTTAKDQMIDLSVTEIGEKELMTALKNLDLEHIAFNVVKTKNADSLKSIDEEIEWIKKNIAICDCIVSAPIAIRIK